MLSNLRKYVYLYAFASILMGCNTLPTIDNIVSIGKSVGYTVSFILNRQDKLSNETKVTLINVLNKVEDILPKDSDTFTDTWTPIVSDHLDKLPLVNKTQILNSFSRITKVLDAYIDEKNLRGKEVLVNLFIISFIDSFNSNLNTDDLTKSNSKVGLDKFVCELMKY